MDTITHALLGAAISGAVFGEKPGRGALLAGAAVSALPDADIVLASLGEFASLQYHRAETPSFILTLLAAPLLGAGFSLAFSAGKYMLRWFLLCLVCLYAHIVLDLLTSWGTEVFAPFHRSRYAWDALPIVDIFFSLPLLGSLLCWLLPISLRSKRICAASVLLWCCAYTALGLFMNQKAQKIAAEALPEGFVPQETRAIPSIGTVFLWNVVSKDAAGNYFTALVSTWTGKILEQHQATNTPTERTRLAEESATGQLLRRTSGNFQLFSEESANGEKVVRATDMRYRGFSRGGEDGAFFRYQATFTPDGTNIATFRRNPNRSHRKLLEEFKNLWRRAFF